MKVQIINVTRDAVLAIAEVADTEQKKRTGLLNRSSLQPGEGVWIPGCDSIHTFLMKFPIDVVFLDSELSVCDLVSGMQPNGRVERPGADSVLELPAGAIRQTGTAVKDITEFQAVQENGLRLPTMDSCAGIVGVLEKYGIVRPGTGAAVRTLAEHGKDIYGAVQGMRFR